jgi:hypothetical protein
VFDFYQEELEDTKDVIRIQKIFGRQSGDYSGISGRPDQC